MPRTSSQFILILPVLLLTGCGSDPQPSDATKVDKDQALTADIAKRCLLEMGVSQIPPGVHVPPPKDEPITFINADEIALGDWHCNLKEKTFYIIAGYPEALYHRNNVVKGVFQRTPTGKWVAKVTDARG